MGLFGSSKSSSSTTNNQTETNVSLGDYSQVDGPQSKIAGITNSENVTISMLDGGAVAGSFDLSKTAMEKAIDLSTTAFKAIGDGNQRETSLALSAINSTQPDTAISGEMLKYGAFAAVAIVALLIYMGRKK